MVRSSRGGGGRGGGGRSGEREGVSTGTFNLCTFCCEASILVNTHVVFSNREVGLELLPEC